jgi:hypothetical protein
MVHVLPTRKSQGRQVAVRPLTPSQHLPVVFLFKKHRLFHPCCSESEVCLVVGHMMFKTCRVWLLVGLVLINIEQLDNHLPFRSLNFFIRKGLPERWS